MRRLGLLPCLLALALSGCITRTVEDQVFSEDYTTVSLRTHKRWDVVEKGYEHPFILAPARAAHILSRVDVRLLNEDGKRVPAIPTESLYLIAEGLADAFAQAGPNQEVVVMSIRRTRRLGVFDRQHLTSFVAYRRDDQLYLHMGLSDWEVPPYKEDRLPEPQVGKPSAKYQVVASRSMTVVDRGSVAVNWRDPVFARPTRVHVTPGGRVVRRTILMESPEEESPEPAPVPEAEPPLPAKLSADVLRALADLEEARERGEITESDYLKERRRILSEDSEEEP